MTQLNREQLIDLATQQYFANVDQKNMEQVLACFHPDAQFTVQTDPITHDGVAGVRQMFEGLFSTYQDIWHGDFECAADEKTQTVCARFNVYLKDHQGNEVKLSNCNFWYVRDGKFERVYVFMSGENVLK